MKKFLFGMFTFSLGLVLGLFFHNIIFGFFPEDMDGVLKGGILVMTVILFFFVWRLAEWATSKKISKPEQQQKP